MDSPSEPPIRIEYSLEEALELLAVLEEVREDLATGPALILLLQVEAQVALLHHRLNLDDGGPK